MNITKERFVSINKWILIVGIIIYLIGVFTPVKYLQGGLIFVFGAAFFNLLHIKYFCCRLKSAAHLWMFPLFITITTYSIPLSKPAGENNTLFYTLTLLLSLIPVLVFMFGRTEEKPAKKERLAIISFRTFVQVALFMAWASVEAFCFIKGSRPDLFFWAMFHVSTVALLPFLFGRVICGWICPNATMQDGLYKNMDYKRPIPRLPQAIDEQSRTCAMNISGEADKRAPLMPATLLLCWFPMFFAETIYDLTQVDWYPIMFMYGLIVLSILFPWRKFCTHFCWLSSYRGLASNNSLWRIRYNKTKCRNCKKCLAEEACPFYIDICNQDNEMPTTCCLCFSCMESCPFNDVITFRRDPEEKARLKAEAKGQAA
jgi:polyferredoxin